MKKAAQLLTRHRTLFLVMLLTATLAVSSAANQRRLSEGRELASLPVMKQENVSAVALYTQEREDAYLREISALQSMCSQEQLNAQTLEAAAMQLSRLIDEHEAQQALETGLSQSGLAPCAAVVSGGSVTIITANASFSDEDAALAMSLAEAHAGVAAGNVRIITAE